VRACGHFRPALATSSVLYPSCLSNRSSGYFMFFGSLSCVALFYQRQLIWDVMRQQATSHAPPSRAFLSNLAVRTPRSPVLSQLREELGACLINNTSSTTSIVQWPRAFRQLFLCYTRRLLSNLELPPCPSHHAAT